LTRLRIYLEGGGDQKEQKAGLRRGMTAFLDSLKRFAAEKSISLDVVVCGGRQKAYDKFRNALSTDPSNLAVLLVDAEENVALLPRAHLANRDGWSLDGIDERSVHLMAQTMETWIVADAEAVRFYYDQGFVSCLPKANDLEPITKSEILELLERATRHTQKGKYHKTRHAPDLLSLLDPVKVRHRCKFCDRLFSVLEDRLQQA
jgi:hypothetical protein